MASGIFDRIKKMANWKKNLLAIAVGVLLVLLLELLLWAIKFHRPICEFDPYLSFKESVPVLVTAEYTNEKWLTLNPRLKAYFNPIAFRKDKPPGLRRIFVLGESATLGFPFGDPGSYAWFMKLGLDQVDPDHQYQVINLGAFGFASYRILRVFREILNYQPDLITVMTGQNEFLEKREYSASPKLIRVQEKLSRFRIYCLLKAIWLKFQPAKERKLLGADVKWEKLSADLETRSRVIEHFRFNIDEMIKLASDNKIPLLLLTCPSNLKDFPPYHSLHGKDLSSSELQSWQKEFDRAEKLIKENKCAEAIPVLEKLVEMDPEYAESWYLLGQCLSEQKKSGEANSAFIKALEEDAWQVRALPEFNAILRAAGKEKAEVLDLSRIFSEQSPGGIPGDNLFYDHCHPKIEAQALIAKEILQKLDQDQWLELPEGWESIFDETAKTYLNSQPNSFFAQADYNLAIEIGLNMGLKDLGKKYLDLGLKIAPEDAKLLKAAEILK